MKTWHWEKPSGGSWIPNETSELWAATGDDRTWRAEAEKPRKELALAVMAEEHRTCHGEQETMAAKPN
jgi:hypothetical protein